MQISKRLGQNIIEFVFIFPLVIVMTLVLFEVAFFWQDVNTVNSINSELSARIARTDSTTIQLLTSVSSTGEPVCQAARDALEYLRENTRRFTFTNDVSYNCEVLTTSGSQACGTAVNMEPFMIYKFESQNRIDTPEGNKPLITMWVDCQSPFERGYVTQMEIFHKTFVLSARIPRFDGKPAIEIIPEYYFIATPKINTIRHY